MECQLLPTEENKTTTASQEPGCAALGISSQTDIPLTQLNPLLDRILAK